MISSETKCSRLKKSNIFKDFFYYLIWLWSKKLKKRKDFPVPTKAFVSFASGSTRSLCITWTSTRQTLFFLQAWQSESVVIHSSKLGVSYLARKIAFSHFIFRGIYLAWFWNVNLGVYYKLKKKLIWNQTWFFFRVRTWFLLPV